MYETAQKLNKRKWRESFTSPININSSEINTWISCNILAWNHVVSHTSKHVMSIVAFSQFQLLEPPSGRSVKNFRIRAVLTHSKITEHAINLVVMDETISRVNVSRLSSRNCVCVCVWIGVCKLGFMLIWFYQNWFWVKVSWCQRNLCLDTSISKVIMIKWTLFGWY